MTLRGLGIQVGLPGVSAVGAAGFGINPLFGLGAGAAVGIASVTRERNAQCANLQQASPAANYLLEANRAFGGNVVKRSLMRLRGGF